MNNEDRISNQQCTMNNVQWKKVKLGDCLTIGNGQDYKHLQSGDIPVFGTGGVMTFVDTFLYDGETVCIGRKGTINKPMYYNGKIWTVDTLFYTHSFSNVFPKFIYYVFCNIDWNKYNEATGVPSLSKETIYKIEISIPSLPVQRRIAAILSSADKVIASTQKVIDKLKQIKQGMMDDLLKPKDGWRMVKLGECCAINPKTDTTKVLDDDIITFIRMEDVSNEGFITSFREKDYKSLKKNGFTRFQNDDVIFAKITPCMENGKGALVRNMKSVICMGSTEFHVLRAGENVLIDFIYQLTISKNFRQKAEMKMIGSAGQQRVPTSFLENCLISIPFQNGIPDLAEQRRIAQILQGIDSKIAAEEKVLGKYKAVKKGLMEKLLNGK